MTTREVFVAALDYEIEALRKEYVGKIVPPVAFLVTALWKAADSIDKDSALAGMGMAWVFATTAAVPLAVTAFMLSFLSNRTKEPVPVLGSDFGRFWVQFRLVLLAYVPVAFVLAIIAPKYKFGFIQMFWTSAALALFTVLVLGQWLLSRPPNSWKLPASKKRDRGLILLLKSMLYALPVLAAGGEVLRHGNDLARLHAQDLKTGVLLAIVFWLFPVVWVPTVFWRAKAGLITIRQQLFVGDIEVDQAREELANLIPGYWLAMQESAPRAEPAGDHHA
jgi:hypothetical protein